MCYLISYTGLFTKFNLFKILLYVTFLTRNFPDLQHVQARMQWERLLSQGLSVY